MLKVIYQGGKSLVKLNFRRGLPGPGSLSIFSNTLHLSDIIETSENSLFSTPLSTSLGSLYLVQINCILSQMFKVLDFETNF